MQQVSDITYRVYDWGREHDPETAREMHLELAVDCIDYKKHIPQPTTTGVLADTPYFTVRLHTAEQPIEIDGSSRDHFIAYLELEGSLEVESDNTLYRSAGGCMLIPATLEYWKIIPREKAVFLEITR